MSTEAQQEYRTLEQHETIEPGDEFKSVGDAWVPVHTSSWHTPAFMGNEYRRPIKPEPPMKSGYMFEQAQAATNRCHQCQNPIGLGYRTNNEGQQFCGERCAESSRKGEAMLASARAEIEKLKTYIAEREQSWRMSSVCREKAKTIEYLTELSEERLQEIERLKSEADGWPDKRHENQAAEIQRLKASVAECERLRQEAVQSEGRAITSRDEYLRQSSFYLQKWNMDSKEKVHYHDKLAVAVEHIQEMEAERDRLAAENSKLLSLIKGCASHFEDLSSVSWSVGSDFSEGSYRELAAEVLKAALAQPEGGK